MASQYSFDDITGAYGNDWQDDARSSSRSHVPSVVVSPAELSASSSNGRIPSKQVRPGHNFSRPAPPPISGSEEQKRQVLMRNAHSHSLEPSSDTQSPSMQQTQSAPASPLPPASPGQRVVSQASMYSAYSYYPYDGGLPSPAQSNTHLSPVPSPTIAVHPPSPSRSASPTNAIKQNYDPIKNPQTAQDYLQLGITHHLANDLSESAACFEKSATIDGGCGMGMLMWGLTQRHGWGCPQSESKGFRWLRRAAEMAVGDLEAARAGMDKSAIKASVLDRDLGDSLTSMHAVRVGVGNIRGWTELLPGMGCRQRQEDGGCKRDTTSFAVRISDISLRATSNSPQILGTRMLNKTWRFA